MTDKKYGFMVVAPVIGVRINDIQTLAGTSEGRELLTILLLIRSGWSYPDLPSLTGLNKETIDEGIHQLVFAGLMDRMEVNHGP